MVNCCVLPQFIVVSDAIHIIGCCCIFHLPHGNADAAAAATASANAAAAVAFFIEMVPGASPPLHLPLGFLLGGHISEAEARRGSTKATRCVRWYVSLVMLSYLELSCCVSVSICVGGLPRCCLLQCNPIQRPIPQCSPVGPWSATQDTPPPPGMRCPAYSRTAPATHPLSRLGTAHVGMCTLQHPQVAVLGAHFSADGDAPVAHRREHCQSHKHCPSPFVV